MLQASIPNTQEFSHLRRIIEVGRKNRGRMQFLLRGFIKKHPVHAWSAKTFELLLRYVRHSLMEVSFTRITLLVKTVAVTAISNVTALIERCRSYASKSHAPRFGSYGNKALRAQPNVLARIFGEELETECNLTAVA